MLTKIDELFEILNAEGIHAEEFFQKAGLRTSQTAAAFTSNVKERNTTLTQNNGDSSASAGLRAAQSTETPDHEDVIVHDTPEEGPDENDDMESEGNYQGA